MITTDAGDDRIYDGDGEDEVRTGSGDDIIYNGGGIDYFDGGDGADTLVDDLTSELNGGFEPQSFEVAFNTVTGIHGRANSDIGQDTIVGIENFTLVGDFNAYVTGGDEDNTFVTGEGDDILTGGAGDDDLNSGAGDDEVYGGDGDDIIRQTGSGTQLYDGGSGNDTYILELEGWVAEVGFTGEVDLSTEFSGAHFDPENILNDTVRNIENVTLYGNIDFIIRGDTADNILIADSGDDTIEGGAGSDLLYGGAGEDTAVFSGAASEYEIVRDGIVVYVTETATGDVDHVEGFELLQFGDGTEINIIGYELVSGGSGDDWLIGGLDADLISTNGGDDYVYGLAGDDRIEISGSGDVVVDTGEGADEIVVAEDAQGSIEIISGGHGDTLLYEGYTGDVTYAHINESGDLVFGTQDLDVILTDQVSYDSDVGKYVVSGVETITVKFDDLGDDDDRISESVSAVVGSDYKEGDLLYTNSATEDNVIFAGAGADTIMVGSGNDVAEYTEIFGDLFNFDQSNGSSTTYNLSAINYNVLEGVRTDDDWDDVLPQRVDNLGDVNVQVTYTTDEYGTETSRVSYNGQELGLDESDHDLVRFETSGYYYDFLIIEPHSEWEAPEDWDYADGTFYPEEVSGVYVGLDTNDPSGLNQSDLFDKITAQYVNGEVVVIDDFIFDGQQILDDHTDPSFFKNILNGYADEVSVVDNSWETQNVSYGDELVFAWAREDVEITDHLNGYYEVEYIGEGADNGKVVEFTDIEKLVFEGGEGAEIQVVPGPVVGSVDWFVDNSWGGAAAGQDISFVDNNVELRVEGNTIKVYADVTVSETVMEMQSVTETYQDSRGRTKTRTVQKEAAVDKEVSHEGELIWEGSHDSISGFDFADGGHVNVISVREFDIGGNAIEMTLGTDDTDLIFGTDGDDVIFGAGGDDLIVGGGGNDTILGGSGDDAILGGSGDDLLLGDFDEDVLRDEFAMSEEEIAALLANQLSDGSNDDLVIGGAGIDEVDGGEGRNVVISGGTDLDINGDSQANIQDIEDLIGRDLFEDEHWV